MKNGEGREEHITFHEHEPTSQKAMCLTFWKHSTIGPHIRMDKVRQEDLVFLDMEEFRGAVKRAHRAVLALELSPCLWRFRGQFGALRLAH